MSNPDLLLRLVLGSAGSLYQYTLEGDHGAQALISFSYLLFHVENEVRILPLLFDFLLDLQRRSAESLGPHTNMALF